MSKLTNLVDQSNVFFGLSTDAKPIQFILIQTLEFCKFYNLFFTHFLKHSTIKWIIELNVLKTNLNLERRNDGSEFFSDNAATFLPC